MSASLFQWREGCILRKVTVIYKDSDWLITKPNLWIQHGVKRTQSDNVTLKRDVCRSYIESSSFQPYKPRFLVRKNEKIYTTFCFLLIILYFSLSLVKITSNMESVTSGQAHQVSNTWQFWKRRIWSKFLVENKTKHQILEDLKREGFEVS